MHSQNYKLTQLSKIASQFPPHLNISSWMNYVELVNEIFQFWQRMKLNIYQHKCGVRGIKFTLGVLLIII
jgi:hypothetical protein